MFISFPTRWKRKCNGKTYTLDSVKIGFTGRFMVWLYEDGINRVHHLNLTTLLTRYRPIKP